MQYQPHKITRNSWIILALLTTALLLFWAFGLLKWGYAIVNQAGIMITAVADILVLNRYILNDYVYSINENGYFTVHRVFGRSSKLLADIRISVADRILPLDRQSADYKNCYRRENFAPSMFPKECYLYLFRSGDRQEGMILECTADVAQRIEDAIRTLGSRPEGEEEDDSED